MLITRTKEVTGLRRCSGSKRVWTQNWHRPQIDQLVIKHVIRHLATRSFSGLSVGKEYQVLVAWKADAANASNALFEVWDGSVKETSLRVNQQLAPADWQDIGDNTLWERLIVFKADSTSGRARVH
jgi:hypothetical protein